MTPIVSRSRLSTRRHFTRRSGAIAQLGERVVRNDEVGGSIPPGSTSLRRLRLLRLGKPYLSEGCRVVARRGDDGLLASFRRRDFPRLFHPPTFPREPLGRDR